jgi:hypothetical protein
LIETTKIKWFYFFSVLYIAICGLFVYYEIFWLYLLPVAIALIMLSFLSIDKLVMFSVLVIPLSVEMKEKDIGVALSLPAEPLIIATMFLFVFKATSCYYCHLFIVRLGFNNNRYQRDAYCII